MKKIPRDLVVPFKMPYLYKDDLLAIENIFKEINKPYKITIYSEKEDRMYECTNMEEAFSQIKNTPHLVIETEEKFIAVNLDDKTEITSNDDKVEQRGFINKLAEIICKRERKMLWIARGRISLLIGSFLLWFGLSLVLPFSTRFESVRHTFSYSWVLATVAIIVGALEIILSFAYLYKDNVAEFKNKENFFIKNKDQIFLEAVKYFIGGVIGYMLGLLK